MDAESLGNAIPLPNNLQSQVRSLKLQAGIRNAYGNKEQAGGYQWRSGEFTLNGFPSGLPFLIGWPVLAAQ